MTSSGIKDFTKGNITRQLIVFSLPLFLSNLLQIVYNMVDMVVVGAVCGTAGISAVSVGGDVVALLTFVGMGFGSAGSFERVKKILVNLAVITIAVAALLSGVMLLFSNAVYSMFSNDPQVLKIGEGFVPIAVLLFIAGALRAVMNALINGSGNYKINFVTAILDGVVMRIGLSLLFGVALGMEHYGFWLGDALAGFTPFLIGVGFYITGLWKKGAIPDDTQESKEK